MSKFNFAESTGPDNAIATDKSKLMGICLTCNYAPTCVRAKHHSQPVWFCEEFDDYAQPAAKSIGTDWQVIDEADGLTSGAKTSTRLNGGLCVNCATRETCTFSGVQTDIWECNEYS